MLSTTTQTDPPEHRSRCVAVVDDDMGVRDSLRFLLETAGFRVLTYNSADQFLNAAGCGCAGCLILDHNMPLVSGLELLAELRSRGIMLPVVLITAAASAELRGRAAALGAGLVLTKPLTGDDLLGFVLATLG